MNKMRIIDKGDKVHLERYAAEELINDRWLTLRVFDSEEDAIDWMEKYRNPKIVKEYD